MNEFNRTMYFWFVTLGDLLPFLKRGKYACKVDLRSAQFHMGIHACDDLLMKVRRPGRCHCAGSTAYS